VYINTDPRTYELSSYSYMILPTDLTTPLTQPKGFTLAEFGKYAICGGQKSVDALGYSPLPINLVVAGFGQLQHVPGNQVAQKTQAQLFSDCFNPTFSTDGTNTLAKNDPFPQACDKRGSAHQCTAGTAGTAGSTSASGANGSNANGANGSNANGANGASANPSGSAGPGGSDGSSADSACDPDSGTCSSNANDAAGPDTVDGVPTDLSAFQGNFFEVALMVVAAGLLVGFALLPPLIAQLAANRRAGRDQLGGDRDQWGGV
jgi:hypothetical protein